MFRERDLDDELQSHLEMRAAELEASGMSPAQAREEAHRRFGNAALTRETVRDGHVNRLLETLWQDVRFGCRMLARQPGFTLTAVITLALAIGANGAIFSALEAVLLRPLPFPQPQQLMFLWGRDPQHARWSVAPADLDDWRKGRSFQAIAAWQGQSVNFTGIDEPTRVVGGFVSPEFFPILGVNPALGRTFASTEDQPGSERVAVLSYGLWQGRLGGDPAILGRKLIFNGEPYTVAGVLPRNFVPPFLVPDVWLPSHVYPNYTRDRAQTCVLAMARLNTGVSPAQAQAELDTITQQLATAYPDSNRDRGATVTPVHETMVRDLKPTLWALTAAAGCLLLIACANVANLLLSKAAGRRQEMAVRAAIGAGRMRIVRQLLTESLVLATAAAALGIGIAAALARYLASQLSDWPDGITAQLNWPVMAFMIAAAVVSATLFGLAPALMARRATAAGLRVRGDAGRTRWRTALATAQVALALVLLIGGGLLLASLRRLLHVDTGFDGSHVLTLEYRLPRSKYPQPARQTQFHDDVVARVRAIPGVEAAGIVRGLPFSGNGGTVEIQLPDRPAPPPSAPFVTRYNAATPTYFETVRIPLRAGRVFRPSDDLKAPRVVVVSEAFVRRFWPGAGVVGRQVLIPDSDLPPGKTSFVPATVVGVVGNTRHDRLEENEIPQLYAPYAQDPFIFAALAVRTRGNPLDRVKDVQRAIWSVDRDQPMWKIRTLESMVDASLGQRRAVLTLLAGFSGLALFLAGLGLYGVIAYQVRMRTAEFGVRVAMGARPFDILRMVLREGMLLAGIGLVLGLAAAPTFGKLLKNQLYGVAAADPQVAAALTAVLLAVCAAAVLLPAWRATRLDPVAALRSE